MNSSNAVLEKTSRSQMQTNDVNSWLRRRHLNKVKQQYLLHPDQIKQEQVIKKIFINFDRDKSKNIDIGEMYDMFQKYGFGVTEKQLKDFFRVVDKDKDNALNWDEFKNSVIDADASKIFYNIIKEVRQNSNVESTSNFGYIPFQFNDMISYLNYLISRNELQESIKQNSLTTYEKFQQYLQLIQLNQNQNQNYQQHANRINEEMKEQTQDELEFTKVNSNKFTYSKTSFYNTNDLPLLLKLKSNKKQNIQKDHNMRTSIDSQQTYLSNQFSLQTNPKSDRYINQKMVNNHILFMNTSSQHKMPQSDKFNKSQNIDSNAKSTPYLQLNINKINSSYRENFQTETNNNDKQDTNNKIDHLPMTLINELQKFQILSGNHKRRHTNLIKTQQNKQGEVNPKKLTSLLKTSADVHQLINIQFNPHSPSNSKLCTPRFLRDEKCITYRKTINRPIFQTYSQYHKSEKPLSVTLKGKSLQIK